MSKQQKESFDDPIFWTYAPESSLDIDVAAMREFFRAHGIGIYRTQCGGLCHICMDGHTVSVVSTDWIRDYIINYAEKNCPHGVLNKLYKNMSEVLCMWQLAHLCQLKPVFWKPEKRIQYFYFSGTCWQVTPDSIDEIAYPDLGHSVWDDHIIKHTPQMRDRMIDIKLEEGKCKLSFTEDGRHCHFLQYLKNASNFGSDDWNAFSLLSKLCAIGYLMMDYKDVNQPAAVIAYGESGSGKSLLGELLRRVRPTVFIPLRKSPMEDVFIWNDIKESTRLVILDNIRRHFDFEELFPVISSDWKIYKKGGDVETRLFRSSPKLYITSSWQIEGEGESFRVRQWKLWFSSHYNHYHKPVDDYGTLFFSEWDEEQWNLTYTMLARCVQIYMMYGKIEEGGKS